MVAVVDLMYTTVDPVLKANVYNSLFNSDPNQPWVTPRYACNTGNCTFEPITTLAAWSECFDLTDLLHTECVPLLKNCTTGSSCVSNCTVSIGPSDEGGLSLWRTTLGGVVLKVAATQNFTTPRTIQAHQMSLPVVQYIITKDIDRVARYDFNSSADGAFVAAECGINIGVQAVQDSITNSTHSVEHIGSWQHGVPTLYSSSNPALATWWRTLSREWDPMAPTTDDTLALPPGFSVEPYVEGQLNAFISGLFGGNLQVFSSFASWQPGSGSYDFASTDTLRAIFYGNLSGCASGDDHLTCAFDNVAKAMTKTFRDSAYMSHGLEGANATFGQTWTTLSYLRIDWQWMSLPFAVWIMAATLWCGTVLKTRRAQIPAWANNILPLLFLYRDGSEQGKGCKHDISSAGYIQKSERIMARLRVSDGKAALD